MRRAKSRDHLLGPISVSRKTGIVEQIDVGGVRQGPGGLEVVFPASPRPQIVEIGQWGGRQALVKALASAYFSQYRIGTVQTRRTIWYRIQRFVQWLEQWDSPASVLGPEDMSHVIVVEYLNALKAASMGVTTKRILWNSFRSVTGAMCEQYGLELAWPVNPFPFSHQKSEPTAPLTMEETASLLRVCAEGMERVWAGYCVDRGAYAGPFVSDLYPFLYVVALFTGMNPDTLKALRLSKLTRDDLGRFVIRGAKPRAGKEQLATLSGGDGSSLDGVVLVERLLAMTDTVRRDAPPELRDFLWLGRTGAHGADFGRINCLKDLWATGARAHSQALGNKAGINGLSLKRMRATAADLIRLLDGGVSVTAILGNAITTANAHYRSPEAKRREQASLARHMEIRSRYCRSDGRRDVRDRHGYLQSAATPGFSCADPFAPPPELKQGAGMCAAYLKCPTCPQAGLQTDSPRAAADLLHLRAALSEARLRMSPARWRDVYLETYDLLRTCLERMDSKALREAGLLPVLPFPAFE